MSDSKKVPIVMGFTSPFRLVLRDVDEWNPSNTDITNRSYDYVKLHRLSTFLDVGISPFSLAIGFDGSLILPAIEPYQDRYAASEKLNQALAQLLLGGVYWEAVSPEDITNGTLTTDGYFEALSFGCGPIANFHMAAQSTYIGPLDVVRLFNPLSITAKDIEDAFAKGRKLTANVLTLALSVLLVGITHYVKHQWASALVAIWTSVEQLITHLWVDSVLQSCSSEIAGRKDFLGDHRTWTTSAKVEVLFQKGILTSHQYSILNSARKGRNDFIHKGVAPSAESASSALTGFFDLLSICADECVEAQLDLCVDLIERHKRGDVFQSSTQLPLASVSHWMPIKPVPGNSAWGDREYERIPEIALRPVNGETR